MDITILTRPDAIQAALEAAEKTPPFVGLNMQAPTGDLLGRLEGAWEEVRAGIQEAVNKSVQEARDIARRVWAKVEGLIAAAGTKATELRQMILDRISKYLQAILDTLLRAVRATVSVEGLQLKLSALELAQKVSVGNSLELSLTKVFEISAGGEMSVSASYTV